MPYCAFYAVPIDHAGNSSTWGKYGISEMTVWVEKSTGKIKTAFPKKGAEVWKWTGLKWEMVI